MKKIIKCLLCLSLVIPMVTSNIQGVDATTDIVIVENELYVDSNPSAEIELMANGWKSKEVNTYERRERNSSGGFTMTVKQSKTIHYFDGYKVSSRRVNYRNASGTLIRYDIYYTYSVY